MVLVPGNAVSAGNGEAQRLIAVSLGKIAACRGQRGGPTLRKSLLISTILHRARTTMMMENFQVMMEARRAQMEAEESVPEPPTPAVVPEVELEEVSSPAAPRVWPVCEEETSEAIEECESEKENSPPTYTALTTVSTATSAESLLQERDINSDNSGYETSQSCAKCTKRRYADCYESDSENNLPKRPKVDSEYTQTDCEKSGNMLTQDNTQISSLVNRFNSGLSGFLGGHVTSVTPVVEESSEQMLSSKVSACASQVTKELGALSRTCIALTV